MKEQIFISYSSQDMDWALIVQNALEEKGYSCWMANNGGINPGENYAEKITEALNNCPVFLLILSPNAVKSPWVPKELNIAISSRKHIIPFQIIPSDSTLFGFQLENIQILSLDKFHNEKSLNTLVQTVAMALDTELPPDQNSTSSNGLSHSYINRIHNPLTMIRPLLTAILVILLVICASILWKKTDHSSKTDMGTFPTTNMTESISITDPTVMEAIAPAENASVEEESSLNEPKTTELIPDLSRSEYVTLYSQHIMEGSGAKTLDECMNSIGEICEDATYICDWSSPSYASYFLDGKYDLFTATLSCPDDIHSDCDYNFLIYLDGNADDPIYKIKMGRSTAPTPISIDISGHESITFFVEKVPAYSSGILISDGLLYLAENTGTSSAEADELSVPADILDRETKKLSSMHIMERSGAKTLDECMNSIGEICEDATYICDWSSPSYASYFLDGKYDLFTATLSCPDDIHSDCDYNFLIYLDGNADDPIYKIKMGRSTAPTPISIDISGHESITFFVEKVPAYSSGILISDGLLYCSN